MRKRTTKTAARETERAITIAYDDRFRLEALVRATTVYDLRESQYLAALGGELRRARVVARSHMPPDVVTMNSTVRLSDLETGEAETYTLVYPEEADIETNKISVLAPVGTALLGYRAGDVVEWPVPAGVRRFRVEEVLSQPADSAARAGRLSPSRESPA
jgi:regulator of nucleoside diphosphate kinase